MLGDTKYILYRETAVKGMGLTRYIVIIVIHHGNLVYTFTCPIWEYQYDL